MKVYKPEEVCEILGIGKTKLRELSITYRLVGAARRYTEADIQNYLRANTIAPKRDSSYHSDLEGLEE